MKNTGFEVVGGALVADPKATRGINLPPEQAGRKDGVREEDMVITINTFPMQMAMLKALADAKAAGKTEIEPSGKGRDEDR